MRIATAGVLPSASATSRPRADKAHRLLTLAGGRGISVSAMRRYCPSARFFYGRRLAKYAMICARSGAEFLAWMSRVFNSAAADPAGAASSLLRLDQHDLVLELDVFRLAADLGMLIVE